MKEMNVDYRIEYQRGLNLGDSKEEPRGRRTLSGKNRGNLLSYMCLVKRTGLAVRIRLRAVPVGGRKENMSTFGKTESF